MGVARRSDAALGTIQSVFDDLRLARSRFGLARAAVPELAGTMSLPAFSGLGQDRALFEPGPPSGPSSRPSATNSSGRAAARPRPISTVRDGLVVQPRLSRGVLLAEASERLNITHLRNSTGRDANGRGRDYEDHILYLVAERIVQAYGMGPEEDLIDEGDEPCSIRVEMDLPMFEGPCRFECHQVVLVLTRTRSEAWSA